MTPLETAAHYYDAWQNKHGDFGDVPLADDFTFTGPVASFDTADGYRAMAAKAGRAVTTFDVRHQFADGNLVCSIIEPPRQRAALVTSALLRFGCVVGKVAVGRWPAGRDQRLDRLGVDERVVEGRQSIEI